jgi:hypothetical protein
LTRETLLGMAGGKRGEQAARYRRYVEAAVREGLGESPWERLEAGVVLGGREFVKRMRERLRGDERERPPMRRLAARASWERVVAVVEKLKGQGWGEFRDQHGDWGRDMALVLGRREGRMTLGELAERVGGIDYVSVASAVRRMSARLTRDKELAGVAERARKELHNE